MASFWVILTSIILTFMALQLPSLSHQLNLEDKEAAAAASTISAAPALLPYGPLSSPVTELSPEIAPLLPSPGGSVPGPTGSSIPTIPSSPSPPNPDEMFTPEPFSAISPSGSLPVSASGLRMYLGPQMLASLFVGFGVCCYNFR